MKTLELLPDEKIEGSYSPTVLSFVSMFLTFVYLLGFSIFCVVCYEQISGIAGNLLVLGPFLRPYVDSILFYLFLMIPVATVRLFRISTKTAVVFVLMLLSGLYIDLSHLSPISKFHVVMIVGILGIILVDVYRRGHKYYITNYRLVLERTFLRYDRRELMLEKIVDLAIEQGIFGRIFDFGNVIPTSAAGVGTGVDHSELYLGFETRIPKTPFDIGMIVGGGKGITGFRAKSHNCFYGVSNPVEIDNLVFRLKHGRSEATKLEDIKRILKNQNRNKDLSG